jgi:AraC-like DNA-binding protein
MKTIFEHTQSRVLVIPQALFSMRDVKLLWEYGNSAIFHKDLEQDLRNIEFYTNVPCFIYIESGTEVLTNSHQDTISLTAGRSIFIPQGSNLHSDFVREAKSLKAKLVFFDDILITNYLNNIKNCPTNKPAQNGYCTLEKSRAIEAFFESIDFTIKEDSYLANKLQELLHLIARTDSSNTFHSLLSTTKTLPPKKNLKRLLDTVETINLSVSDLAHLSGRSLSTFNRDFKAQYQVSAKQWLLEKRLIRARELLESEKHSVTDVALMVGYSNVSHFIKAFKTRYGQTPKAAKSNGVTENR